VVQALLRHGASLHAPVAGGTWSALFLASDRAHEATVIPR
jgi:hypothetical protein